MKLKFSFDEIENDPVLSWYGLALAFSHFVTWFWIYSKDIALALTPAHEPLCWPFFPNCWKYHTFSIFDAEVLVLAPMVFAAFVGVYILRKRVSLACWLLLFTSVFELGLIFQDYRFRLNQSYMLLIATFTYLLIPRKREVLGFLIVAFYFWAGRLKLTEEWLSGATLYFPLWFIPQILYPAACVYVVILEMILIWGLFSRSAMWFWATFFQLCLFHLISYSQVGYFYPVMMMGIIAFFPLTRLLSNARISAVDFIRGKLSWSTYFVLAVFSFFQIHPLLYSGDSRLIGTGRIFTLHMFEARQICTVYVRMHFKSGVVTEEDLLMRDLPPRRICDPIIYFGRAKNACRQMLGQSDFVDLDFEMKIGLMKENKLKTLASVKEFCKADLSYNSLLPNSWMDLELKN